MPYGRKISLLNIKPKKNPQPICTIKDMYKDIHSSTVDNSENKCQWVSYGTSHNRILYNMNVLYKMKVQSLGKILNKTKAIPQILLYSPIYFSTVKIKINMVRKFIDTKRECKKKQQIWNSEWCLFSVG